MDHDPTTTFACPHCGKRYPRRPQLVDRAVRCKQCSEAFRLRADGSVEVVGAAPAASPRPTAPQSTATAEPTAPPQPRPKPRVDADALRASLARSMQAAAASTGEGDPEGPIATGADDGRRPPTARHARRDSAHGSSRQASVVLTGEGERSGARRRRGALVLAAAVALAFALGAAIAFWPSDPLRDTLRAYDRDFSSTPAYPDRHRALAASFWGEPARERFPGRIADAELRELTPATVGPALTALRERLAGHRYLPDLGAWVRTGQVAAARDLVHTYDQLPQEASLDQALIATDIDLVTAGEIVAMLEAEGLDETTVHALASMLHRDADALRDTGMHEIQLARFHAPTAAVLRVLQGAYRVEPIAAASGLLVRQRDESGWSDWRILTARTDDAYAAGLPTDPLRLSEIAARSRIEARQQILAEAGTAIDEDALRANLDTEDDDDGR